MDAKEKFATILRDYRMEKSISIRELARKSKISERQLFNFESGKHLPTIDTFMNISLALGVDPQDFIKRLDQLMRP